jgi:hypothetical protein
MSFNWFMGLVYLYLTLSVAWDHWSIGKADPKLKGAQVTALATEKMMLIG